MDISTKVASLSGIGDSYTKRLEKLDITTIFDLLYHIPARYEDRRPIASTGTVQAGETAMVRGNLISIKSAFTKNKKMIQTGIVDDESGPLSITWFNQPFLTQTLKTGMKVAFYGKVELFAGKRTLLAPDYEIDSTQLMHMGRITPIYHETAGITSKWFRAKIFSLLKKLTDSDTISGLKPLTTIHFPTDLEQVEPAKRQLAFDELLLFQLKGLVRRSHWQSAGSTYALTNTQETLSPFITTLPFTLTDTQQQAIAQIASDISQTRPMNRLLEGDVGSGKTVVAAAASYIAHQNGYKTLLLAPTQILATQHYQTLTKLFTPHTISVGLVTGNKKLTSDQHHIIVGTHALLNAKLDAQKIGLVVIDEQHRFGVLQRTLAMAIGKTPHTLTMTATPIPRSIALTLHGDLDLSVLSNPPSGRLPVKTWIVPQLKRDSAYEWIATQLNTLHTQAFIVCPYIEPSETNTTIKAAAQEFEKLKNIFSRHTLGLLHGKLTSAQKDAVLEKFKNGNLDILVTTPVVEVGIDIPNAAIMVIEDADHFGLAQLHQLRGRVGRSSLQSYCLLFAQKDSPRLKALETHNSGIDLAEIDLKLRGPGDIFGITQHGRPIFKIADYSDLQSISAAVSKAKLLFPDINSHPVLRNLIENDKIAVVQPN